MRTALAIFTIFQLFCAIAPADEPAADGWKFYAIRDEIAPKSGVVFDKSSAYRLTLSGGGNESEDGRWFKRVPVTEGKYVVFTARYKAANVETPTRSILASIVWYDEKSKQVEQAVKTLGFRGIGVAGSVAGEDLSNPKFHPFWAKCEELGVLVFMHPLGSRELEPSGRLAGNGLLTNTIGNPLETTIALSHLIFEGTLDRFPGLKICAAHGGGFLPSYANRSDAVITTFPNRVGPLPKKTPTEYIRGGQLYFDSIMFTGEGMRHLIAEAGIDHVVLGTDYPFPWNTAPVDHVMSIPGLSDEDRIKILGGTAAKLLGIEG